MKPHLLACAGLTALCAFTPPALAQGDDSEPALQDVIIVTGQRLAEATETAIQPDARPLEGPDITLLIARTPGAARIGNGALSGQMQYRGLFGERLNLRVDGQRFSSGGPNLMDPVFHYAPAPLVEAVVIDRGISPVSAGPGLGGGADAVFKRVDYADSAETAFGYDLTAGLRSVDESYVLGGIAGASTNTWRFNVIGAYEEGEDTDFPDGTIAGTAFERGVFGAAAGVRLGGHEFSLDLRRQNTGPSGNPPFPMDIRYFDSDFVRLGYASEIGEAKIEANLSYADIAHGMNNFDQRPVASPMRARETFADATTIGGDVAVSFAAMGGSLQIGLDGEEVEHDVRITNPNNADFFVDNLPDITMRRLGGFAEWRGGLGLFESEIGLRVDTHEAEAGEAAVGPALPMGPRMLAMGFNAADRSWDDTTVDAALRLWTPEEEGLSWRVTLAHKTQVPSYLQRFGWLPLSASGGLADGNIYVGDLELEAESAWIGEAGFDWRSDRAYLRPTLYIREVENYIQGVPFDDTVGVIDTPQEMIANMNGDPTPLRFANTDARLYGIDFDAGYDLVGPLRLDAVATWVRGERTDIDDDLYRISPPSLTAGLTWEEMDWSSTFELRGVAEQDRVSLTNSELETPGYVIANLYGEWRVADGVRLSAGIENLLDHTWRDHLAGYNRNGGSDVPVGARLPGPGRSAFLRLSVSG